MEITTTCNKCQGCAISSDTESSNNSRRDSGTNTEAQATEIELPTATRTPTVQTQTDFGGRRRVARFFNAVSKAITTKAAKQTEKSGFKQEERTTYPTTPGENFRNPKLAEDISIYNHSPTPIDGRSRAGSFMSISRDSDNGEGSSKMARNRSRSPAPAPVRHSSLPAHVRPPPRSVTRPSHSNSEPEGGLFGSSLLGCPPSPRSAISEWRMNLSPVSGQTPEGRSRTTSVSDVSPTTTAPTMSGVQTVPTIHVSSHEGS